MSVRPSEPTATGVFFAYPATATGTVADYWLACGGTRVRKTSACKRALLATFEAVIERAVAIANAENSMSAVSSLASADYSPSAAPFSAVDLGEWGLAAKRAGLGAKLVRGCPQEEWNRLVGLTWSLWRSASGLNTGHGAVLFAWQVGYLTDVDTDGWVSDDYGSTIYPPWLYDLSSTPCDEFPQLFAPWGTYAGGSIRSSVGSWLDDALVSLGRQNVDMGSPGMPDSFARGMMAGMSPFPLGTLDDGHLGNWMGVTGATAAASSVRFSSAAWAVIQTMLANMRFTHLAWDYSAEYTCETGERTWSRIWALDPSTLDIILTDDPDSPEDVSNTSRDYNFLRSGSRADFLHGSAAYDFKFEITSAQEADLVMDSPPRDGVAAIADARDYLVAIPDSQDGLSTATANVWQTVGVNTVTSALDVYPALQVASYLAERGPVVFVDAKNAEGSVSHSVREESGGASLTAVARGHAGWLLTQVRAPRSYPSPAAINTGAISSYSSTWWGSWKFVYPPSGQPNWPRGSANPTQYFPVAIANPDGNFGYFADDSGHYVATRGAVFGTFALAFPDYPFGWTANEDFTISAGTNALAGYKWQFKALPAT